MTVAVAALVVGGVGGATAATGGSFLLGKANSANHTTTLTNSGKGPALNLKTKSSKTPPLSVSNKTVVPNLNADLLDGREAKSLQTRVSGGCSTGITSVAGTGRAGCASGATLFAAAGDHVYTVPARATAVLVQVWGAGGGGGYPISWAGSSGGGQGSYVEALLTVAPGDQLLASVGAGGNGGGTVDNACCYDGTGGGTSTRSIESQVVVTAPGGEAGGTANTCPNSGIAEGGSGAGPGTVSAPAVGLSTKPGATGAGSHSASFCGGGDGAGGAGGGAGFAGAGGAGKDASGDLVNGDDGSNGLIIITVIG